MRIQRVIVNLLAVAGMCLSMSASVRAHHAFDAEFDRDKPIKVQGKIVKVDWRNPHAWVYVAVTKPDGQVDTWMFEGAGVAALTRRGFTKDFHQWGPSIEVTADGYMHRGIPFRAAGRSLKWVDGRTLFVGATGTGAPDDVAEPPGR